MQRKAPRVLWLQHRKRSKNRTDKIGNPIEFRLTFEEWWKIWSESGHWEQRGIGRDSYVMSRKDDLGHYEVGNVFIQTQAANMSQAKLGSTAWNKGKVCPILSQVQLGKKHPHRGKTKDIKGTALLVTRHKALRFE